MRLKLCLVLVMSLTILLHANGRQADTLSVKPDSVKKALRDQFVRDSIANQLEEYTNQVRRSEQKRIDDSVKKAELLQQITLLKENDKLKQADLLRQIQSIEQQDSIRKAEQLQRISQLKKTATGYPVAPFEDTLFMVFTKLGPVMPRERAINISRRLFLLRGTTTIGRTFCSASFLRPSS